MWVAAFRVDDYAGLRGQAIYARTRPGITLIYLANYVQGPADFGLLRSNLRYCVDTLYRYSVTIIGLR